MDSTTHHNQLDNPTDSGTGIISGCLRFLEISTGKRAVPCQVLLGHGAVNFENSVPE